MKVFNNQEIISGAGKSVYISKIDEISDFDSQFLMEFIVEIVNGRGSYDKPDEVLSFLINRFDVTKDKNKSHGYIAELLSCCILRSNDFTQEYCCQNLEENSIKKGFDGIYLKNNELYILESKSSYSLNQHNDEHNKTVNKAFMDIEKRFTSGSTNNPWANAVHHAKVARSDESLVKQLSELKSRWANGDLGNKEQNNIILSSTIFSETIFEKTSDYKYIGEMLKKHNVKNEIVLLSELKSSNVITDYLKGTKDGQF
jgi:hypothetical protein